VLGRWRGGFSCKIHLETDFHGWVGASIAVAKPRFGRGAPREARIAHLSATLTIAKKSGQIFRQGVDPVRPPPKCKKWDERMLPRTTNGQAAMPRRGWPIYGKLNLTGGGDEVDSAMG
jgi:hypothetical protein